MTTITTIAGLFELLRQGRMSPAEIMQWLARRGPVPPAIHKAELQRLDEALNNKIIDDQLHRTLLVKLRELQNAGAKPKPAAQDDRTVVNPTSEQTVVNPSSAGQGSDDFDLLLPDVTGAEAEQTNAGGASETTAFAPTVARPQAGGPHTGSRTATGASSSGPPSASSWERMAAKADAVPEASVYPGMMLKERFYLEKEVGRGGMGVVYKARDERKVEAQDKNPWVAVKILNDEFRHHPQSLIALQREARKAQQLTHDNILRVYDFDKAGAIVYITMEYADGGTVKEYVKKGAAKGGWTYAEGQSVIEGMARGLARAHRDGIVHSDFKPGNVMMGEGGVPKVFDLGIARAAKTGDQKSGETTVFDAATLGALTPAYASLEMMRGEDPQIPDDIYALAISTYEVLTGKHPFAKKNAEEAFKAGLKPAPVPGLTRLQWRTLQKGLAFERKNRLQTAEELIDGMRPRTIKDYALPLAIGAGATIGLIALVLGVLLPKLQDARVEAMVQKFEQAVFADHNAAVQELAAMDATDRDEVKQKGSAILQDYFFKQANARWDLTAKHYDYADALAILNAARTQFPDSKSVDDAVRRIDKEKNDEIARLDDELGKRVAERRIYEDQKDNAVEILDFVRRMDPQNGLLNNQGLQGTYGDEVRRALSDRDLVLAEKRVASALRAFPAAAAIKALAADVSAKRNEQLALAKKKEQLAAFAKMTPDQVRTELTRLAAAPDFSPDWQAQVDAAVGALARDATPQTVQVKETLAAAFSSRVAADTTAKSYGSALSLAELGLRLFPNAPGLLQEKAKLDLARKAQETELAAVAAKGQVDDLKIKLVNLAKADNISGAEKVFADLKARMPAGDPYMTSGEAPKLLGEAYIRQAKRFAEQSQYEKAQQAAARGVKAAPAMEELKALERDYSIEMQVATLEKAARSPAAANGEQLLGALAALKASDPQRHSKVMGDLLNTTVKNIEALIPGDRAGATRAKAEWLKVFPQNQQLASLTIPEGGASPSASLPQEAKRASRAAPGVDTCEQGFAGFGSSSRATCSDDVAGAPGPKLVVVPGVRGGRAYAITKYEITVQQFNVFCSKTGKCSAAGGNDNFPRTGVSFTLAKAYANWLSETTGFSYRLPTDAEWANAAEAGGKGAGGDFNCVLMQGDQQIKGGSPIDTKVGRAGGWGVVNMVGNAAEWVDAGGSPATRGGHFKVPTSRCTVEWSESSSGEPSDVIGVRLVREMG